MKRFILFIFSCFVIVNLFSQGLTNNGGYITVQNGAYISIAGGASPNVRNQTNGPNIGNIDNNGTIDLTGHWTNTGNKNLRLGLVRFTGTVAQNINGDNDWGNIEIKNAAGVAVQSGDQRLLEIMYQTQGNFATNNAFTVVSTPAKTALIDGGLLDAIDGNSSITGDVIVQRYVPGILGYHYFAVPTSDATVNQFADDMSVTGFSQDYETGGWSTFWYYDETVIGQTLHPNNGHDIDNQIMMNGWKSPAGLGSALTPMLCYCVNMNAGGIVDITGNVNNGAQSINITYTSSLGQGPNAKEEHDGWNVIGNPYPCPIDWDAASGWTRGPEVENAIYIFNPTSNYFGVYKYWVNGIGTPLGFNSTIPAMQGFTIRTTANTTLSCDNRVRIADLTANSTFHKKKNETSTKQLIRIASYMQPNKKDEAVIYLDEEVMNKSFNMHKAARKKWNNDEDYPNIYSLTKDNIKTSILAINNIIDSSVVVPLGLFVYKDGVYTIQMMQKENIDATKKIYLEDRLLNKNICLDNNPEYSFSYSKNDPIEGRFFIKIANNIDNINTKEKEQIFVNTYPNPFKDELNIAYNLTTKANVKIQINDILGNNIQEVYNKQNDKGHHTLKINTQSIISGLYFLQIIINDAVYTSKISKL